MSHSKDSLPSYQTEINKCLIQTEISKCSTSLTDGEMKIKVTKDTTLHTSNY